jgi:hypothetical protein
LFFLLPDFGSPVYNFGELIFLQQPFSFDSTTFRINGFLVIQAFIAKKQGKEYENATKFLNCYIPYTDVKNCIMKYAF